MHVVVAAAVEQELADSRTLLGAVYRTRCSSWTRVAGRYANTAATADHRQRGRRRCGSAARRSTRPHSARRSARRWRARTELTTESALPAVGWMQAQMQAARSTDDDHAARGRARHARGAPGAAGVAGRRDRRGADPRARAATDARALHGRDRPQPRRRVRARVGARRGRHELVLEASSGLYTHLDGRTRASRSAARRSAASRTPASRTSRTTSSTIRRPATARGPSATAWSRSPAIR